MWANVCWVMSRWQAANPAARQYAVGNPIAPRIPLLSQFWPNPPAGNVTLDFVLEPLGATAGQILNTKGKGVAPAAGKPSGILCYKYV